MRKLSILLLAFGWFLALFATAPVAVADTADMHLGNFNGTWCNYPARFDIQNRDGDSWVFHGRILIKETGQYDELWLEQYDNNSLRMIRYLGGDTTETGDVQTVQTAPPQIQQNSQGQTYAWFQVVPHGGNGFGCETYSELYLF